MTDQKPDYRYLMLELRAEDNPARQRKRERELTALIREHGPGDIHFGKCLVAQVTARRGRNAHLGNTHSWRLDYERGGKRHQMGLGSLDAIGPLAAWDKAKRNLDLLDARKDPLTVRREEKAAAARAAAQSDAARAKRRTFRQAAAAYMSAHKAAWAADPSAWPKSLETYAHPIIGDLDVALIETAHVLNVLKQRVELPRTPGDDPKRPRTLAPFWQARQTTAHRVRGRVEAILDWAVAHAIRPRGDNPARWHGHLEHLLAAVEGKTPHACVHYDDAPGFMAKLASQTHWAAPPLAFRIHTVADPKYVLAAKVSAIDTAKRLFKIPRRKRKGKDKARILTLEIPVSDAAWALVEERVRTAKPDDLLFPCPTDPRSAKGMLRKLTQKLAPGKTVHGFRSTFENWAGDKTTFDKETRDFALGHIPEGTDGAYRGERAVEQRRRLMAAWSNYLESKAADNVTRLRRRT